MCDDAASVGGARRWRTSSARAHVAAVRRLPRERDAERDGCAQGTIARRRGTDESGGGGETEARGVGQGEGGARGEEGGGEGGGGRRRGGGERARSHRRARTRRTRETAVGVDARTIRTSSPSPRTTRTRRDTRVSARRRLPSSEPRSGETRAKEEGEEVIERRRRRRGRGGFRLRTEEEKGEEAHGSAKASTDC